MTFVTQMFKAGLVEKFRRIVRPAMIAALVAAVPMVATVDRAEARSAKYSKSAGASKKSVASKAKARPRIARARVTTPRIAEGGPYEALAATTPVGNADPQFRSLFLTWKKQDQFQPGMVQQGTISVPSAKPIRTSAAFTSGFGVRSDPFRGGAAMHAGIDLAGPIGTPIYATADGVVGRAEWANGYGNLVEIDHGRGIATRYGHLSAFVVHAGDRVKRGDLIARMGSTGRSTGSHLHYEVRLDGRAVNPVPYLQSSDYLVAMQNRTGPRLSAPMGLGGPEG